jgi:hypothetical protein
VAADAVVVRIMVLLVTRSAVHRCRAQLLPRAVTFRTLGGRMPCVVEGKCPVLCPAHTRREHATHVERPVRSSGFSVTLQALLRCRFTVVAREALLRTAYRYASVRAVNAVTCGALDLRVPGVLEDQRLLRHCGRGQED